MQGLFSDVPLIGVLSLLHDLGQSGTLDVEADLPFTLNFRHGEVVDGGILDWQGLDAIQSCPLVPASGSFSFHAHKHADSAGAHGAVTPLMPYDPFSTEWARVSDEWQQTLQVIGSPSAIFQGQLLPTFKQPAGCSVRAAAAFTGLSLADMSSRVAAGVRGGQLNATGRYAWFDVVLPPKAEQFTQLARHFDGHTSLGQLIGGGLELAEVRADLIYEIRLGLRFAGCGWVLRDLLWESQHRLQ